MSRVRTLFVTAAVAIVPLSYLLSDEKQEAVLPDPSEAKSQRDIDRWMQIKLKSSQEVFAGLMNGDFEAVRTNVRRMQVLGLMEAWSRRRGEYVGRSDYEKQLNAFDDATKELLREADRSDVEGTLEAYVKLSRSCVRCHQVVRDAPAVP